MYYHHLIIKRFPFMKKYELKEVSSTSLIAGLDSNSSHFFGSAAKNSQARLTAVLTQPIPISHHFMIYLQMVCAIRVYFFVPKRFWTFFTSGKDIIAKNKIFNPRI